jgi:hypothetical protein
MYDIAFGVYTLRSLVSLAALHLLDFIISCTRTWSRKTIPLSLTPDIEAGEGGHYSCALEARRPCPLHNSVFFRDPNFFPLPRLILARFHQGSTQYTRRWSLNVKQTKDQSSSPSRAIRAMAFSVQRSSVPSNTRTLNTIAVSSSSKQKKHYGSRTTVGYMRP